MQSQRPPAGVSCCHNSSDWRYRTTQKLSVSCAMPAILQSAVRWCRRMMAAMSASHHTKADCLRQLKRTILWTTKSYLRSSTLSWSSGSAFWVRHRSLCTRITRPCGSRLTLPIYRSKWRDGLHSSPSSTFGSNASRERKTLWRTRFRAVQIMSRALTTAPTLCAWSALLISCIWASVEYKQSSRTIFSRFTQRTMNVACW